MWLINVQAFIKREWIVNMGCRMDHRAKVLEFRDDEATDYAILSHRWIDQEVHYDEITEFAKMERDEQDEIRHRDGYQKILASCEQAKRDGYEWLWADTCCIDKRSSAELSEAINSMYRWYQNSKVCYAYLHDVPGASFPTQSDNEKYRESNGWPEWFSRGWTLQEMIAPGNVQFFNQNWQSIGDKRSLAHTLTKITRVPWHILTGGLSPDRPCVAQIMSWAADRKTTRVEDRAYSLLGLLDVNMPMLYGEGKKAFQRLQLEIIRVSDDQSIFAWGAGRFGNFDGRTGSILADDPNFFRDCGDMKLMDREGFIEDVVTGFTPEEELHSIEDRFGVFPVTNRGIQIWMLLFPLENSDSVFEAWLPCKDNYQPVRINLVLWDSNYYRYGMGNRGYPTKRTAQFRQVYLRYHQDSLHSEVTFEIDDSAITNDGFTCCTTYKDSYDRNTLTLTNTEPVYVRFYSNSQHDCYFAVGFGQCFGKDWIHVCKSLSETTEQALNRDIIFRNMLSSGPDYARSTDNMHYQSRQYACMVKHFCLPGSTCTIRASRVVWNSSRNRGVKIEVFGHPYSGPEKWIDIHVEGTNDPNCDMRGLTIPWRTGDPYWVRVHEVFFKFSRAPDGTNLGDYGYLTDYEDFRCEGNIFDDVRSLPSKPVIIPKKDGIWRDNDSDYAEAHNSKDSIHLYDPIMWSLPSNDGVNSLLASLSTRLINRYLVIRVIECPTVPPEGFASPETFYRSLDGCESMCTQLFHTSDQRPIIGLATTFNSTTPLCDFAKPFVWYRHESINSGSDELSSEELRAEIMDVDEE
ncbi:heterokaryon incompatibility protein-domain-containing protein [Scleroderma yunnanense]